MITVGVREAREKLAEYLDEVEKGEDVVITRRDRPVARISSLKKVVRRRLASRKPLRSSIDARGEPVSKVVVTDRREGDR